MIAMRWLMRAIGLINTVVLARLLTPDDFGVVAMSAVVVELLMMLGETHVDIALIRDQKTQRDLYDSAWTIQAIFGVAVAVLLALAAHPLALYYDDPRVEPVIYILALRPAILGFENVGVAEFRKNLDFAKDFRYGIWRRLSLFIIGLGLALTLQNYWALAIAAPISAVVAVFFSFVMSSYRPRIQFSHALFVWSASRWFILQNLSQSALDRSDEFIIGGVSTSTAVGNYYIAAQVAPMPTRELAWPMERALMPTFAKVAGQPDELRHAVLAVMGVMGTACCAAGFGIMSIAEDFVWTVFGERWTAAVPFFQWLALFGIFVAVARPLMALFYALGRERLYAVLSTLQVAVTIPVLVYAALHYELVAIAAGRTIVAAGFFVVYCAAASAVSGVRLRDFAAVLWRPAVAGVVMTTAIRATHNDALPGHFLPMTQDIAVGILVFGLTQGALWLLAGRPEGSERIIWRRIVEALGLLRQTSARVFP
jgi:O-antigen/teichoic acid export membrane protein